MFGIGATKSDSSAPGNMKDFQDPLAAQSDMKDFHDPLGPPPEPSITKELWKGIRDSMTMTIDSINSNMALIGDTIGNNTLSQIGREGHKVWQERMTSDPAAIPSIKDISGVHDSLLFAAYTIGNFGGQAAQIAPLIAAVGPELAAAKGITMVSKVARWLKPKAWDLPIANLMIGSSYGGQLNEADKAAQEGRPYDMHPVRALIAGAGAAKVAGGLVESVLGKIGMGKAGGLLKGAAGGALGGAATMPLIHFATQYGIYGPELERFASHDSLMEALSSSVAGGIGGGFLGGVHGLIAGRATAYKDRIDSQILQNKIPDNHTEPGLATQYRTTLAEEYTEAIRKTQGDQPAEEWKAYADSQIADNKSVSLGRPDAPMDKTTLTINSQIADLTKSMGVEEQFVDKTKTESTEVNDLFDQLKLKQKEEADRQAEEVRVAAEAKAKADADIPVWDRPWDPNAVPEKGSGIKSWEDYPAMKIGKDPKNVIPEKTVEADASKSGLQEVYSIPEDAHDHQLEVWNLLDKDGKNVGGISKFTNKLTGENYIGERYLDPSLRGTGIGSQLLDKFPGTEPTGKASTIAALKASDSYKADKAAEVIPQPEAKVEGQPQEPEPTVAKSIISKEVLQDVTDTMVAQFGMRKGDAKVFIKNLSGNNPELTTAEQLVTAAIKLKGQGGGVPMAMRGESEFIRKEGIRVMTPGGPGVIASKGAFGIFTVKLDGEKLSRRYKTKEITELISPETTSAFTDTDSARFVESRDKSEYPEFLTPYTAEELAAFSTRKLPGKDAGYSVKPDGDIVNIFNNTPHKGLGVVAIIDALRNGGKKLDCFDIFLTNYYRSLGFEEVSRSPWDDQYAPPNWDYEKNGRPNVVYLEFRGEANADNIRRSYEDHWNTKLDNDPITAEVFNRGNRGAPQEEVTRRDDAASRAIPSIAEDRVQGAVERQEVKVIQPIVDNFINDHMPALKGKYEVSQGIDDVTDGDVRNRINAEIDPTQVKAMYNPKTGKFHIISDHLNYPGEAIAAILHEGFHAGLPSIFPNDIAMNNFLKEVYDFYGKDKIDAALSGRGYEIDHNKPEGQLQAANEMLANLEKDSPTLWQQLIDRMVVFARHLGEKFGFDVKFDERDIRRALDSVQEALTKPDDSRAYTGDGPPLAMRIASLPNWAKDLVDKAQSRNFMDNPDLSEEGKRIVNQATKQVKQFDSGAAKWWELYLSRPFQNAVRRPAWRRPWMIFGVERPELRANFDNDNYRLQQQLFKTTDPGSLDKITSLTFAMDAYKVALPGLTKEQRAETLRLKHIPKETLMEGIMIKGKMHQFTEAEADAYINQTKAISHMFESKMRFIEENMMRDFRNSKWYGILLNAHGEVNDEATQRLGARDLPLIGKANARDMRIQVRDVFANLEQQIEGLTPEQQKNLLANYQDTYNMLETGIKGIQEVVGKQLGIEGAELSKTSQEVVQAYLRTRPYMKMISEARKRFQADPFYAPRIRGKGDWAMKVFKDVEDPETGETKTTEVYSRYHDGKPRDIAEVMKMIYTETDANGTTEYADNGKLREGYRVTNERKDRTAEWSYGGVNDLNTFTLVRNAINRIRETGADPEAIGKMKDLLIQYLGEEMQARGWGHGIQRQHPLIKGYDTADLKEVMQKYTSGLGGLMSKQNSAREYLDYMMSYKNGKVKDVTFEPREFEALAKYGQDMLRNPGKMDRVVSWYRGLSMNFFLGGLIRAPLMHAAANYTWAIPELNSHIRANKVPGQNLNGFMEYHKSMKDIGVGMKIMQKVFTKGQKAVESFDYSGITHDGFISGDMRADALRQFMESGGGREGFVDDLLNPMMNIGPRYFRQISDVLMRPFQSIITFNRISAFDAMFRTSMKINQAQGMDLPMNMHLSYQEAQNYVFKTQGVFNTANRSPMESGGDIASGLARGSLTFRSFMHQYALWMVNAIGKRDFRAVAESLAWTAAIGGLGAMPLMKDILDVVTKHTGYNPTQAIRNMLKSVGGSTMEQVGMSGIPSLFGFKTLSHPAIGIPFMGENPFQTLTGSGGNLVQGEGRAYAAMMRGDWAGAIGGAMPQFIAAPFTALRQSEMGKSIGMQGFATTPHGKPIFDESGKPMQYTPYEVALKSIGLYPSRIAEEGAKHFNITEVEKYFTAKRQNVADTYRVAKNSGDKSAMPQLIKAIKVFNDDLKAKGAAGIVPPLRLSSILKSTTMVMTKKQRAEKRYLEGGAS